MKVLKCYDIKEMNGLRDNRKCITKILYSDFNKNLVNTNCFYYFTYNCKNNNVIVENLKKIFNK